MAEQFERVFSEHYLEEAGMLTIDLVAREARRANFTEANTLLDRFEVEFCTMYQNYRGWEKQVLREINELDGPQAVDAAIASIEAEYAPERKFGDVKVVPLWLAQIKALKLGLGRCEHDASELGTLLTELRELYDRILARHDGLMSRVNALLSILHREHGQGTVEKVISEVMRPEVMDPDGTMPFREKVESIILFTRVHLLPFTLTEDAEKMTFMPDPCPSGGRLIQQGHYDSPRNDAIIEEPSNLTWQQADFPIYCCHEPAMERSSILKTGMPVFLVDPSNDLGRVPCKTYIYKNPADIPERFFERVGLSKQEHLILRSS